MVDAITGALVAISILTSACCCICLAGVMSHNSQIELVYVRNPIPPRIVVQSTGSDEPEDPVDFSSNPKSSATSLGS